MAQENGSTCGEDGANKACRPKDEARLLADGWQARFVADPRMAKEALASYGELGYEVELRPLEGQQLDQQCGECLLVAHQFRMVYTRRREPGQTEAPASTAE